MPVVLPTAGPGLHSENTQHASDSTTRAIDYQAHVADESRGLSTRPPSS